MAEFLSFIKRMIMALVAVGLLSFLLEISQMLIIPVIENALPGADLLYNACHCVAPGIYMSVDLQLVSFQIPTEFRADDCET